MFKDCNGQLSSMRISMFLVVSIILTIYVAHNIVAMTHGQGLVSFGFYEVSALGIALAGKVAQKFSEDSKEKLSPNETTKNLK